jgi:predicted lipoprotein with Yx(FWY)xxD motif
MRNVKLVCSLLLLLIAGYAFAADMPEGVQARKADSGTMVLADSKGMTLYTLDRDAGGKSMCNGNCAMNWPALVATTDKAPSADWTVVTRDDGTKMWAYKGKPLYTFAKDMKPGDTTGDGVGKVWHTATP